MTLLQLQAQQSGLKLQLTVSRRSIVFASKSHKHIVKAVSFASSSTAVGAEKATPRHIQGWNSITVAHLSLTVCQPFPSAFAVISAVLQWF
jgi:hypothetical protein